MARPDEQFPAGSGAFLLIAALGALAWLVLSMVFADISQPSALRRIDGLWGWVILAMFQLMLRPQGKSAALRITVLVLIVIGLVDSVFSYSWNTSNQSIRSSQAISQAIAVTLAVLATSLRGMTHLSGRAVKAADVWMFVAMQWLLVWAAADLVLTWRSNGEPAMAMRQRLAEMLLLGAGVHTAIGLALTHLSGPKAGVRDRASLAALISYEVGLILLLFGLHWWGCVPMFLGIALFLVAGATLLTGQPRPPLLAPLLLLCGCMFVMAASLMRPFDDIGLSTTDKHIMYAGWRHATAGGCVALSVIIALSVAANAKLAAKYQARGVLAIGAALFVLGVVTRLGSETNVSADFGLNKIAIMGSALEIFGLLMVSIAAIRGRGLRRNMAL